MSDIADRADREVGAALNAAIAFRKSTGPIPNGKCHYCHSSVPIGTRWCDSACKEDWDKEQAANVRAGK